MAWGPVLLISVYKGSENPISPSGKYWPSGEILFLLHPSPTDSRYTGAEYQINTAKQRDNIR